MTRVCTYGNYGVFVGREKGGRHHSPHAHVRMRGQPVCTVHLVTLEPLQRSVKLPKGLLEVLEVHQEDLIAEWERLNND